MNGLQDITEKTGLFYYITMKDFEREESRKSKKKCRKLDSKEKFELHALNQTRLVDTFAIKKIQRQISLLHLNINNYEDLFDFFSKFNLLNMVQKITELNKFYPCQIIEGNLAWVSMSDSGHYRYFSKDKDNRTIGFDFIDLLEIYYGVPTSQTIENAVKEFRIRFMEDEWMNEQNRKYLSNLTIIHNAKKYISKDYPALYAYINKHLKMLETMNVLGNIHVKKQEFNFENQNIFFASSSYISDFMGNQPLSTTNKIINIFAVLGLIRKLPEENIPSQLLHESKAIAERRNLGNIISYYVIPPMIDIMTEANERAKLMNQHNVRYSNISKEKVAYVFGEDLAKLVYVQEIQKNKKKSSVTSACIHTELERNLMGLLDLKGYTTQRAVMKKAIPHTSLVDRERELKKIWKSLILKHELLYIKPTEKMKKTFKLKTNEYITVKRNRT